MWKLFKTRIGGLASGRQEQTNPNIINTKPLVILKCL